MPRGRGGRRRSRAGGGSAGWLSGASAAIDSADVTAGTGDVLEPENGLIGIGSGGPFALAAARALTGDIAVRFRRGEAVMAQVAMCKNVATDMCSFVVDQAVIAHETLQIDLATVGTGTRNF